MRPSFLKRVVVLLLCVFLAILSAVPAGAEHFAMRGKNQGPLKSFTGSVYIIVVYVNTPRHPWTEAKKNKINKVSESSVRYMKKEAKRYGTELDLRYGLLEYTVPVEFSGEYEWFEYIIQNIYGEKNIAQVYERYARDLNVDSAPILFMFNSDGRSYSTPSSSDNPGWINEFCVIFCDVDGIHDNYLTHEVMHLYGAIDLYDYNHEGVERVAKKYFPKSDMLTVSHNIDDLNAYLVGWTNQLTPKAQKFLNETEGMR